MENWLRKYLSTGGATAGGWRAPLWSGWVALGLLVLGFSLLTWWLFFSPLSQRAEAKRVQSSQTRSTRQVLAVLLLFGTVLGSMGARWDELWHRLYGGFGDDFLWPPHMLMYGSLGMTGGFALSGLIIALRGAGGLRERFRAEPLMGLLGLISAYQIASIPSDLLWHRIIGPDISAWSLPHLLLGLTGLAGKLAAISIALSTVAPHPWLSVRKGLSGMEAVALALISFEGLGLLQLGVTEWEWLDGSAKLILLRPVWTYPVVVLLVGMTCAYLALYATRRIGAASAVSVAMLLMQAAVVLYDRSVVKTGPILAAHVLLVLPALALDIWYARGAAQAESGRTLWGGAVLYVAVYLAVAFPYLARFLAVPVLNAAGRLETAALCLAAALIAGPLVARVGALVRGFGGQVRRA